ncbi:unnamed protein product [Cuscuta europaea]|uniref:Exonuclease 1 n=1 Tax=Cuscuta europaea TaxID=41803 RepID=A0A9P1EGA4_CUSEU|nr:unnamed protein product [Cuscuta europaea]
MGIKDLLRFMKPHLEHVHIKKYAGKRVGIDAYSWLHKGAYSCSMELCLNMEGDKKLQYLNYFMHRINLLRHYKIIPVVVFDGGNLPCKASTEDERYRKRKANRDQAMALLKEGNVNAAAELFQRAVSITPAMAHQLIQILRSDNIEFVVAPYEADAQLAYMASLKPEKGGIAAVITEDSDLLAYGCPAVVLKMDRYGNGEEFLLDKVFKSVDRKPFFTNFTKDLFIGMCVLAGCDFLPSVPGIGITKAYNFVSKYRNLDRVLSILKFEKGSQVPEDYSKSFKEAVSVFEHARIYDIASKKTRHMEPIPESLMQSLQEELDFLGPEIPHSIATSIAQGKLNPCTMEAFDHLSSAENNSNPKNATKACSHQHSSQREANSGFGKECFVSITSRKLTKEANFKEQEQVSGWNQVSFVEEKHLADPRAFEKLLNASSVREVEDDKEFNAKEVQKVPDNNPFRKRCFAEVEANEAVSFTGQVSVEEQEHVSEWNRVSFVEQKKHFPEAIALEELLNPSSGLVEDEKEADAKEDKKVPNNNPFQKECFAEVEADETDSFSGQASLVTEAESFEVLTTSDSQKSVNSKVVKRSEEKRRGSIGKKAKRSNNSQSSISQKSSILNFFSRV